MGSGSTTASGASASRYLPGDRRQQQGGLHQGEVVADADPRAAAEGEIGVAGDPLQQAVGPALGAEGLGIVEPARVAVDDPLAS